MKRRSSADFKTQDWILMKRLNLVLVDEQPEDYLL